MSREFENDEQTTDEHQPGVDPEAGLDDDDEEEEIPFALMVVLVVLALGIAAVYLTIGGGHNHFH